MMRRFRIWVGVRRGSFPRKGVPPVAVRSASTLAGTILVGVLGSCSGRDAVFAQQPLAVRIARLVEGLGAASYAERVEANRALAELGSAPREQLETAARSADAEVAARARDLLRRIALDELWLPSRIRYMADQVAATEALDAIRQQTGNRLLIGDRYGGFHEAKVSLNSEDALFWEVIDDFCRQTKNHVRPHYDTRDPGLALVHGEPGAFPVAYSGPVRASITGALRTFSEEFDYKRRSSKITHHFRLSLDLLWEDRLRIVAYRTQAEILEAITDGGQALSAPTTNAGAWNVAGSGVRQVPMELKLEPPPTSASKLSTLVLSWPIAAIGDFASVATDNLTAGSVAEQDDVQLTVDNLETKDAAKHTITISLARNRPVPDPAESWYQENRFEAFDASGRPLRLTEQTNALEGGVMRAKLAFMSSSEAGPPAKLQLTYPRLRSERKLEIVFRDVPLPTGKLK